MTDTFLPTRRTLHWLMLAAVIGGFAYLCAFKILDQDFWWHVKSGQIMRQTHDIIRMEPFSFVLEGRPYHSSHEWLAQIFISIVYDIGGITGAMLFRTFMVLAAFLIVLGIDWKRLWPYGFVVLIAGYSNRPSFLDRPQLFTFLLVALSLWLADRFLRNRRLLRYALTLLPLQILWVNLHGAASIFGIIIAGAVLCQLFWEWLRSEGEEYRTRTKSLFGFSALIVGMFLMMLLTPNGWQPFRDLFVYATDKTLPLIREWMPMVMHDYLRAIAPFGLMAIVALLRGKKFPIAAGLLIIVFGSLSLHSFRHCIIFVLVAIAVMIMQLRDDAALQGLYERIVRTPMLALASTAGLLLLLATVIAFRDGPEIRSLGYFGYGAITPVAHAFDFVEKENIHGVQFNTYNQGTYLIYRTYPDRKVFFDGRNLEYGYEFMQNVIEAGRSPSLWQQLNDRFHFTYAIVDYKANPEDQFLPYVVHFDLAKDWALVYLDDDAAVYLKNIPENKSLIKKYAYHYLTPTNVEFDRVIDQATPKTESAFEAELVRMAETSPESIKSRLILGRLYLKMKDLDRASVVANQALSLRPGLPEVYELLGLVAAEKGTWMEAGIAFERALSLSGGKRPINYFFLSDIFQRAGDYAKATDYARRAEAQIRAKAGALPQTAPSFAR